MYDDNNWFVVIGRNASTSISERVQKIWLPSADDKKADAKDEDKIVGV